MKIEQIQTHLIALDDTDLYADLFNVLYGSFQNVESEILMSVHLLKVWVEAEFKTPDSRYLDVATCGFLMQVSEDIKEETGYIIFRL